MKAVILCGGLGERLRPKTETVPKVMLEVKGKPILEHQINFLKKFGLKDIVLLARQQSEKIEEYFGDGKKFGVKIEYSVEKEKLGTAGAVKNAERLIDDDFLLINGDVITNFPLDELLEIKGRNVVSLVRPENRFGVAKISNIKGKTCLVEKFIEKPKMDVWINAGYTVLKKSTLKTFPEKGDIEKTVYVELAERKELSGYLIGEEYFWKAIDTPKDLKEANEM